MARRPPLRPCAVEASVSMVGAMYIVDYGQHATNLKRIAEIRLPFGWPTETGIIWKVVRIQ